MTREYPNETKKNAEAEMVYWFHVHFLGTQPDASHYAAGTKILLGIMKESPKYPGSRVYTRRELADTLYKLRDEGIRVSSLTIVKFPDLVRASVDDDKIAWSRITKYLRDKIVDQTDDWKPPKGW